MRDEWGGADVSRGPASRNHLDFSFPSSQPFARVVVSPYGEQMRTALMSSLAQTHVRTRLSRRAQAGSGPSPPANAVAWPKDRSIAARARYRAVPNGAPNGAPSRA